MTDLRKLIVTALLALAAQACSTSTLGRFDTTHVADLTVGSVDRAQVTAWFGDTDDVERFDGVASSDACIEARHWSNSTRQTYQNLTVYFDRRGVVCDHVFSGEPRLRAAPRLRFARSRSRHLAYNAR